MNIHILFRSSVMFFWSSHCWSISFHKCHNSIMVFVFFVFVFFSVARRTIATSPHISLSKLSHTINRKSGQSSGTQSISSLKQRVATLQHQVTIRFNTSVVTSHQRIWSSHCLAQLVSLTPSHHIKCPRQYERITIGSAVCSLEVEDDVGFSIYRHL